jgi:multicomponent Na+:H+ antiporter subunit C
VTVLLAATAATLFGLGTYLVLQRKLSRIIIGIALLGHGANVLMVTSGRRGRAPIVGNGPEQDLADPLPQALALTAIVISFGVTALLLALAYRSWLLTSDDEVQDDLEDRDVARRGAPDDELSDIDPHAEDVDPDVAVDRVVTDAAQVGP